MNKVFFEPLPVSGISKEDIMPEAWAEINTGHIVHNIKKIGCFINNIPMLPVIKNNAYGHGIVPVGRLLEKIEGVAGICVGKLSEARQLIAGGVKCPIINFGPFDKIDVPFIVENRLHQSVFHENIELLDEYAGLKNKKAHVHIKIDTGLGRVGVQFDKAKAFIEKVSKMAHIQIEGIFTASTEDLDFESTQLRRFLDVCEQARQKGIHVGIRHMASSAAILSSPNTYLDAVRPGISTFGYFPSQAEYEQKRIELKPAFSLKAKVSFVKKLKPGDSVSYHRLYRATHEMYVATVSIGYSDGWFLNNTDHASVLIKGTKYPVVGSITSNHLSVIIPDPSNVKIGDVVTLFGTENKAMLPLEPIAYHEKSSEYKLLSRINPFLPRFYK